MDDPALYGDYDYWPTRYTGTSDNGGVHWNSGIANLAFALAVKGGTHPRGKTSIVVPALSSTAVTSIQMGAAIFYRANTQCMTASSTFQDASGCTQQAVSALYGCWSAGPRIVEACEQVVEPVLDRAALAPVGVRSQLGAAVHVLRNRSRFRWCRVMVVL